jgi:hypothetical protein
MSRLGSVPEVIAVVAEPEPTLALERLLPLLAVAALLQLDEPQCFIERKAIIKQGVNQQVFVLAHLDTS